MSLFRRCAIGCLLSTVGWCAGATPGLAAPIEPTREQLQFFETEVRPLLVARCHECHGAKKQKGGLRLDSSAALHAGGDSGPAVEAGDPAASLLWQAVNYEGLEMPPGGKLPAAELAVLRRWIEMGAPWPASPADSAAPVRRGDQVTQADRDYWAFQPIRRPALPPAHRRDGGDESAHPVDRFLDARLAAQGVRANGPASPRQLVRRLYVDLLGLPPDADQWQADAESLEADPTNYERLVDRLLADPAYGERWGRHWLDVVRYAQTNGYERDGEKPFAWRYRDYVIRAFNSDLPYDRFVVEQLAGDELPDADATTRTATGFYRLGVWDDEPDDARQAEFDGLDDLMVTTGAAFLGLSLGCARCHDHKFDPLPQADYYRLAAFFRNIRPYARPEPRLDAAVFTPIGDDAPIRAAVAARERRVQELAAQIAATTDAERRKQLEQQQRQLPLEGVEWTLGVRERGVSPPPTHVLIRGAAATPGKEVEPGFPQVLTREVASLDASAAATVAAAVAPGSASPPNSAPLQDLLPTSGRRLQLARWLAAPDNPLVARVLVNRLWHYHFGRGLVETTSDLGKTGTPPSHPELIDWLAAECMEQGWSIKRLHRLLVTSDAYRRSSDASQAPDADPGNRLWWRQNLRRLEAEALRDGLLAATGELHRTTGGRGAFPRLSGEALAGQSKPGLDWEVSPSAQLARRSVYLFVKRGLRDPFLESFDYANTTSPLGERPITTVAPQALALWNGRFVRERAAALVARLEREAIVEPERQIERLYRDVLGRRPDEAERRIAGELLRRGAAGWLERSGVIEFRPDVPASLFGGYRRQLPAEEYLLGPRTTWSYLRGAWGGGYEGIDVVDSRRGPAALWQGAEARDGRLAGRLRFGDSTESASLLLRASADGDAWRGLALTLSPPLGRIELRQVDGEGSRTLAAADLNAAAGRWVEFRLDAVDRRIDFELQGEPPTRLTAELPAGSTDSAAPGPPAGRRWGVAVWGGAFDLDDCTFTVGERTYDWSRSHRPERESDADAARREALIGLAVALFNVNEFLYVD